MSTYNSPRQVPMQFDGGVFGTKWHPCMQLMHWWLLSVTGGGRIEVESIKITYDYCDYFVQNENDYSSSLYSNSIS